MKKGIMYFLDIMDREDDDITTFVTLQKMDCDVGDFYAQVKSEITEIEAGTSAYRATGHSSVFFL